MSASPHIILGAMFRAVGAYPAGWRYPGAHRDPRQDRDIYRTTARLAEDARLDYLFIGDWLATGPDLEYRDPYLVARIDPLTAATYLAAITDHIGVIATANTTYSDPFTLARATASIDLLSGGRAGLNLVTGAEPRAAGNHGREAHWGNEERYDRAEEFVQVLRSLWDSFEDDAFLVDPDSGEFFDHAKLHRTDFEGSQLTVTGPLNTARPPQGHLPIVNAGTSPRSRQLVSEFADLALVAVPDLDAAVNLRQQLRTQAASVGRDPDQLKVITPILPVVGETLEDAWAIVDQLLSLVPLRGDGGPADNPDFPVNRSLEAFAEVLAIDLSAVSIDDDVTAEQARAFSAEGDRLLRLVTERTGRSVDGARRVTFRHLLATSVVPASFVVGDAIGVADHLERWFRAGAVDGFNVLTAIQPVQFEAFTSLVVPELQRRGLFRTEYSGETLRDHLGLSRPANVHVSQTVTAGVRTTA